MTGTESPPLKSPEDGVGHVDLEDGSSGELVTVDNTHGDTHVLHELPPEEARRILRKVDYRLVPLLAFLYLVAYVDRGNSMSPCPLRACQPVLYEHVNI
jgi:hypothetical protein